MVLQICKELNELEWLCQQWLGHGCCLCATVVFMAGQLEFLGALDLQREQCLGTLLPACFAGVLQRS